MNCAAFVVACVIAQPGTIEQADPPTICGPGQVSAYVCKSRANVIVNGGGTVFEDNPYRFNPYGHATHEPSHD